jgi:hemolysin activation/secretion protein
VRHNTFLIIAIILFFSIANLQLLIKSVSASQLSSLPGVYVKQINVKDNVIIPQEKLSELIAPYENREVTIRELEDLRLQLSKYYMDLGYINSGVLIPEQDVSDGNIDFLVIAGKITDTSIIGNTWLVTEYISRRLELATQEENGPFNINVLQERLKLLKQDPKINNINASIAPGVLPGEATSKVEIEEARPYTANVGWNNYGSPSVGGFQYKMFLAHYNLTGWGDQVKLNYSLAEGADNYSGEYIIILSNMTPACHFLMKDQTQP